MSFLCSTPSMTPIIFRGRDKSPPDGPQSCIVPFHLFLPSPCSLCPGPLTCLLSTCPHISASGLSHLLFPPPGMLSLQMLSSSPPSGSSQEHPSTPGPPVLPLCLPYFIFLLCLLPSNSPYILFITLFTPTKVSVLS